MLMNDTLTKDQKQVQTHVGVAALEEVGELCVEVVGEWDVGEHSMELVGELVTACLFQPVDHGFFEVHRVGLLVDETLPWNKDGTNAITGFKKT